MGENERKKANPVRGAGEISHKEREVVGPRTR